MKKIKLLLLCISTLLMSANLKAAYTFEEVFQFGQNTSNCGGVIVNAAFSLSENYVHDVCDKREFRIAYFQDNVFLKCGGYNFMVYSSDSGGYPVLETSGFLGANYANPPIISSTFELTIHPNEEHYEYFIVLEFQNPYSLDCQGIGQGCNYVSTATTPLFKPNWEALPSISSRPFNLDSDSSQGAPANFLMKCFGDAMNFSLSQEVADDLNCSAATGYWGAQQPCADQYAGLKITKVDANRNPIDSHKFIGTQEWINSLGLPSGYPDVIVEDFIDDLNNDAEIIPLLPLFGNYMTNNFGYYELEFTYYSLCGEYKETMLIEYVTTYKPTFNFAELASGGGFTMSPVSEGTSFLNPFISCQGLSILNLTNVSPDINSTNPLRILVERFDNTSGLSDTIVADLTFPNWGAASSINLRNYAYGDPTATTPTNAYASYYNNWSGLPSFILDYLEDDFPGITDNYYDNQDDIYKISIEYTTICGAETSEMWFTPAIATCKKIDNEEVNVKIKSSIYPNPIENELNISFFTVDEQSTISIYNVTGQNVFNKTFKANTFKVDEKINLGFLDDGIYFLQLKSFNGIETHRVVKR